jgi:hypothetical protein
MSNPGGASISAEQLTARYVGTGTSSLVVGYGGEGGGGSNRFWLTFFIVVSSHYRSCRYDQTVSSLSTVECRCK